ncbi:MAG: trypsin-like peptidase domain-containing protein, partial [Acidobacteriaceae bacterium]
MSTQTNLLRARTKRFVAPVAALALTVSAGAFVFSHNHVHAAMAADNPIAPINNASIDPLLALDQATEAVASRVTPAVVNIAVTSHREEQPAMRGEGQEQGEGENPFSQFFGPGFGQGQGQGMPGQGRGQRQIEHGIGSGVIISPDGYIVTNNHVVEGAMEVRVTLHDRRTFAAKVIGT